MKTDLASCDSKFTRWLGYRRSSLLAACTALLQTGLFLGFFSCEIGKFRSTWARNSKKCLTSRAHHFFHWNDDVSFHGTQVSLRNFGTDRINRLVTNPVSATNVVHDTFALFLREVWRLLEAGWDCFSSSYDFDVKSGYRDQEILVRK